MIRVVTSLAFSLKVAWDWLGPMMVTALPMMLIHTSFSFLVLMSTSFPYSAPVSWNCSVLSVLCFAGETPIHEASSPMWLEKHKVLA